MFANIHYGKENKLLIRNAVVFFNDLYHRFLLSSNMKAMCLQAMTIVYTKCHEEIGSFHDTKYIVAMLERTSDRSERDRLLMFIDSLILNKSNVKEILGHSLILTSYCDDKNKLNKSLIWSMPISWVVKVESLENILEKRDNNTILLPSDILLEIDNFH